MDFAFRFASTDLLDAPAQADTIHVTDSYTLASGDTLKLGGNPGFKLEARSGASVSLEIDGAATLTGGTSRNKLVGVGTSESTNGDVDIRIGETGVLSVSLKGGGSVAGVDMEVSGGVFHNAGELHVTAGTAMAFGAAANLTQNVSGGMLTNTGLIEVETGGTGYGVVNQGVGTIDNQGTVVVRAAFAYGMAASGTVAVTNAGEITAIGVGETGGGVGLSMNVLASLSNTGAIHASGPGGSIGVWVLGEGVLDNDGKIIADSSGGMSSAVYSAINGSTTVINHGVIKGGDYGVVSQDAIQASSTVSTDTVMNFGKIFGDIVLGAGADSVANSGRIVGDIDLGAGGDSYAGEQGRVTGVVIGGQGADTLAGGGGTDTLHGDGLSDAVGDGDDLLRGLGGDDRLFGGQGADTLTGGAGGDFLTGGAGDDVFSFLKLIDSGNEGVDLITDLTASDRIDLHAIDADAGTGGDQAFHLVASFSGAAGELTVTYDSGTALTTITGDTDGDGHADMTITASGDHHDFTNFVL